MKKYIKRISITIIISLILSIISGLIMYKKIDNTSQETLLKYVSSKKSDKEGLDLMEVYIEVVEGYEYGDNVVGADVSRIMADTIKNTAITVLIISFIVMLIAIYKNKMLIYCLGIIIVSSLIYILPKYEIDFKYKNSYESIDENIESMYNELNLSYSSDHNNSDNNESDDPYFGVYDPEQDEFSHLRILPFNKEKVYDVICDVESPIEGLYVEDIDIIIEPEMRNGSVYSINGIINLKTNLSKDDIYIAAGEEDNIGTELEDNHFLYSKILSYVRNIREHFYAQEMIPYKIDMFDVNGELVYEENLDVE